MPKTKISEFSATANSNTDINSINIAEGCAPSNINDAIRELMAELKDFQAGTKGDSFNGPVGTSTAVVRLLLSQRLALFLALVSALIWLVLLRLVELQEEEVLLQL